MVMLDTSQPHLECRDVDHREGQHDPPIRSCIAVLHSQGQHGSAVAPVQVTQCGDIAL